MCAAHDSLEQWDQAITASQEALQLNPANQPAKNTLAWAQRRR